MRLLISCVDGSSLKETLCAVGTDSSVQNAQQPLKVEAVLSDGSDSSIDVIHVIGSQLLLGRCNGKLELVQLAGYERKDYVSDLLDNSRLDPFYSKSKKRVKPRDGFVALQQLRENHFFLATKSGLIHILKVEDSNKLVKIRTFEVVAPLEFAQLCDDWEQQGKYVFGYGGEENQIKLVEIEADFTKLKHIWEAKNVKNDRLDMRVPVWPTGMKFLESSDDATRNGDNLNYQFVVITHWSHLGHYKTLHGRRPLVYKQLFENREPLRQLEIVGAPITSLGNVATHEFQNFAIVTTDTKKNVYKYSVNGRLLTKFGSGDISGAASFIKAVEPRYLLEGGLDRYARIYDVVTGERLVKVYGGASINYMVLLDADTMNPANKQEESLKRKPVEGEEEEEANQLWKELEQKNAKKQKK